MRSYLNKQVRFTGRWMLIWSTLMGLLMVHLLFGLGILDPTNTNWLYIQNSDWIQYLQGLQGFLQSDWHWPPGLQSHLYYPLITSSGYTDLIPLLAFLFKIFPVFSSESFQYFGLWLGICYTFQGFFAMRIIQSCGVSRRALIILGALFFITAPVLLYRSFHIALCSHWLILAMLAFYLDNKRRKSILYAGVFVLIAAAINPYIWLMCTALYAATLIEKTNRLDEKGWTDVGFRFAGMTMLSFLIFYLIGYFQIPARTMASHGLNEFSSNMNALWNSLSYSTFFPALPIESEDQYEGFAYLGAGIIAAIIASAGSQVNQLKGRLKKHLPLIVSVSLLTFWSWSFKWTFNDFVLFDLDVKIPQLSVFRSSGRLIWPLYYCLMIFAIVSIARFNISLTLRFLLLALLFVVQIADIRPIFRPSSSLQPTQNPLRSDQWQTLLATADVVIAYPPFSNDYNDIGDYAHIADLAINARLPVTTGYFARYDYESAVRYADSLGNQVKRGDLSGLARALFIVDERHLGDFHPLLESGLVVGLLIDDYPVLITKSTFDQIPPERKPLLIPQNLRFLRMTNVSIDEYFIKYQSDMILVTVKDEARSRLCPEVISLLESWGSSIRTLQYRGSYAAIFENAKLLAEVVNNSGPSVIDTLISGSFTDVQVSLRSEGSPFGDTSIMKINGLDWSPNQRGMNLVVLGDALQVLTTNHFDTYFSCTAVREKY